MDVRAISLSDLLPDPSQPRREFDQADLENLAQSLKADGQLQAIKVRPAEKPGQFIIVYGERRYRAAQLAGLESLACIVQSSLAEEEVRLQQLVENLHRSDLSAEERASAYRQLMDLKGWTGRELADVLHVHPSTVSRALSVSREDSEIKKSPRATKPPARVFTLREGTVTVQARKRLSGSQVLQLLEEAARRQRRRLRSQGDEAPHSLSLITPPEREAA